MANLGISDDELRKIVEEALGKELPPHYDEFIIQSGTAIHQGQRGGEAWSLSLIKMLAMSVAISRKS